MMSLYKKVKNLFPGRERGLTMSKAHNRKTAQWCEKQRREIPGSSTATGIMKAVHSDICYKSYSHSATMD